VILDETEKHMETGSDLHALLNEGHCKGGAVWRVLGEKQDLCQFSVFGAVALAHNGRLPYDLEQRSIVIEMQRRLPGDQLAELREGPWEQLRNLAKMCARFADDNVDAVREHDPDMGGLINRPADNWRPLFAIADVIGGDWPERIREACAALMPKGDGDSNDTMLLLDIGVIFDKEGTDRLSSEEICEALIAMEGRPWGEYGKSGKPITKHKLANRLNQFGIRPNTIRVGRTAKGYYRRQFEEAWVRYVPSQGVNEPSQRNNADGISTSEAFQTVTRNVTEDVQVVTGDGVTDDVTGPKCEKPPSNGLCYDVTVQKGDEGGKKQCAHCGQGGDTLEVRHGMEAVWLQQTCLHGWREAQDDLTIPEFLRRVPAGAAS